MLLTWGGKRKGVVNKMSQVNIYRNALAANRTLLCPPTQPPRVCRKKGKQLHSESTQAIQLLIK